MDPKTREQLIALLKKTEADVVRTWQWPIWREPPRDEERPGGPRR
jgi:hypothetical protein